MLHGEVERLQVDHQHPAPLLFGEFDHPADLGDADVVVEHVDAAVGFDGGLDQRLDLILLGGVDLDLEDLAPLAADQLGGLGGGVGIDVGAHHLGALAGEQHRGGLAVLQPGPIEPAPTTTATLSCNRSAMTAPF